MWLGSGQQLDKIDIREVSIMSTRVSLEHTVRDLVSFSTADSLWPTMSLPYVALATTNCVSSAQWYVPYQLMAPRPLPCHAFISCRLDYCNSILTGVTDCLLRRLQSLQNAAAHLVTGAPRSEHITPILRQLGIPITIRPGAGIS